MRCRSKTDQCKSSKTLSAYFDSLSKTGSPPEKTQLDKPFLPETDHGFIRETETLIAAALLLGMDHAARKLDMADDVIPVLPFADAVSFMKSRIPMDKIEWDALEPKLRFRAFTVARLAQCDYIDAARQVLYKSMETGKGVAETYKQWQTLQTLIQDDAMKLRPGYWENVFRTNTQTAYTAGKLIHFQNNPPPAWRLLIVDDSRTSGICRGLIQEGKQSLALASDHPFWQSFGFPPYHYQCRTGLQAVYKSEIDNGAAVENPAMDSLQFKPMEGFGGNPLDNGNYWMMTKGMFERGLKYGIINEFNMLDNIVTDFNSVWKGYKREFVGNGWIDVHESIRGRDEFQKNFDMAKKEAALGNKIKMLPVHEVREVENWKNADYLINASLWELESPNGSTRSIRNAISGGQKQAPNLIIEVPENADRKQVLRTIRSRFLNKKYPLKIRNLIFYHGSQRDQWTADQIRKWPKI